MAGLADPEGTRVSKNLFYNNNRDIYVEVAMDPIWWITIFFCLEYAIDNMAQGGAL